MGQSGGLCLPGALEVGAEEHGGHREGEALPEITFCLCSLGVMVVSAVEPQVCWLLWDLLALLTSLWIPHVSPCVSAGPFA